MITYIKFIKISLLLFCAIIIIIGFSASQNTNSDFSSSHIAQAQQKPKADAIGVRVLPNPEHYDPLTWYRQQGFKGDPEKLRVDGYRAVREGRSVYINAANIEDNNLKTYIYIISFNQEIGPETIEIFNRIISNWEFNTNISQEMGKCEISALFCDNDDSCPENYICSENKCLPSEGDIPNCRIDSDCPQGLFCNSPKARIVRDVKRLADIGKIKTRLEKYYNQKGKYPVLSSGSYVKYKTLSAWPSWQKELGKRLGIKLPQDPVNALGDCGDPRFQPRTCWDKQVLEFAGDLNSTPIDLPSGSKTYFYNTTDPHNYKLCGLTETGYKNLEGISCSEKFTVNNPPVINCSNLRGSQGHPFSRHVEAVDPEGDNIENWTIESVDPAWSDDGGEYITISKSGSNQALLKADQAPAQRNSYNITLSTTDSFGAETSKTCTIEISDLSPEISADCPSEVRINNEYGGCRIEYSDPESGRSEASFFYSWKNDNKPDGLETKKDTGKITGTPTESGNYSVTVWAQDEGGLESNKINLNLAVNTYCGDGEVQNLNMEGTGGPNDRGYEQCEDDGEGTAEDDQYECNNCAWTGGWCGDDTVQDGTGDTNDHEEECEGPGEGTSEDDQYECNNCAWTGGWCGDDTVQDGTGDTNDHEEECDGPGEGTSENDQYECASDCTWTGGWCGDGICGSQDSTYSADDSEVCGVCGPDCGYDHDNDGDGIGACSDNCPEVKNPSQSDLDSDGIGDLCDACYDYNGRCVSLTVSQGSWSREFYPYATQETVSDFYCYSGNCPACTDSDPNTLCTEYGASSNIVEYNVVKNERSEILAHINHNNYLLSLIFIHDEPDEPEDEIGGHAGFTFSGSGWNMAHVAASDDERPELSKNLLDWRNDLSPSHGNWGWGRCCTDGGALEIAPLNTSWSITISPEFAFGINSWMAKSPGGLEEGEYIPDIDQPVTISYSP